MGTDRDLNLPYQSEGRSLLQTGVEPKMRLPSERRESERREIVTTETKESIAFQSILEGLLKESLNSHKEDDVQHISTEGQLTQTILVYATHDFGGAADVRLVLGQNDQERGFRITMEREQEGVLKARGFEWVNDNGKIRSDMASPLFNGIAPENGPVRSFFEKQSEEAVLQALANVFEADVTSEKFFDYDDDPSASLKKGYELTGDRTYTKVFTPQRER